MSWQCSMPTEIGSPYSYITGLSVDTARAAIVLLHLDNYLEVQAERQERAGLTIVTSRSEHRANRNDIGHVMTKTEVTTQRTQKRKVQSRAQRTAKVFIRLP